MLSPLHVQNVCLLWEHDARSCRYLREEGGQYQCCKLRPIEASKIDLKIKDYIKQAVSKKKDPFAENVPLGDNCPGYPIFKHVEQGYDK